MPSLFLNWLIRSRIVSVVGKSRPRPARARLRLYVTRPFVLIWSVSWLIIFLLVTLVLRLWFCCSRVHDFTRILRERWLGQLAYSYTAGAYSFKVHLPQCHFPVDKRLEPLFRMANKFRAAQPRLVRTTAKRGQRFVRKIHTIFIKQNLTSGHVATLATNYLFEGGRADLTKSLSMNPAFQVTHSFALGSQAAPSSYNFGAIFANENVSNG